MTKRRYWRVCGSLAGVVIDWGYSLPVEADAEASRLRRRGASVHVNGPHYEYFMGDNPFDLEAA